MKTKTIYLYEFDELPAETQNKVIKKLSDINVNYNWWEFVYQDFFNISNILGVDVDLSKTYFSGFYHQGQGSAFTAGVNPVALINSVNKKNWQKHAPKLSFRFPELTMRVLRIERLLHKNIVELVTNVRPANRGTAISVESYEHYHAYPLDVERDIEHTKDFIEDVCEELNKFLFKRLRDEYDYRSSRETIIETIKANQYYFTEKGNIDNDKD